jgi:hypothetical protein
MRPIFLLVFLLLVAGCGGKSARAEPTAAAAPRIEWEVKSRFRLFRSEADFQRHVEAMRGDGVLAAERRLASETDGRHVRSWQHQACLNPRGQAPRPASHRRRC